MPDLLQKLAARFGALVGPLGKSTLQGGAMRHTGKLQAGILVLMDVDDLKSVNLVSDFDTGDRLLDAIGDILRRALPRSCGLERLASGRFVFWIPGIGIGAGFERVEALRRLAATAIVDGSAGELARTLSAGIVETRAGEPRARALLHADQALARAKGLGGNRTEIDLVGHSPSRMPDREEIEAAIVSRALEYYVQPIVDLRDARPVGVEALLRWNRDDGRVMGPASFIDTLNRIPESGSDLFADMAEAAAGTFTRADAPIYCTFNITGAVLDGKASSGCRWLSALLERLPPEHLVVEIVESAVILRPERAADLIERLRSKGVRVALDDFGTGLSNLERLRRYPVDIIKTDRVFIDGLGSTGREEAILESLAAMARRMDINVVAEGVETAEQVRILSDMGIHYGQGYHFGHPAPAADWATKLTAV